MCTLVSHSHMSHQMVHSPEDRPVCSYAITLCVSSKLEPVCSSHLFSCEQTFLSSFISEENVLKSIFISL